MKTPRILILLAALLAVTISQGAALADYAFDFNAPVLQLEVEVGIIGAFDNILHNTGSDNDTYTVRLIKDSPDDWVATMCIGTTCYPPFVTEVDVDLSSGDEIDLIVDLTPGSAGIGSVTMVVTSHGSPGLSETRTFTVNTPGYTPAGDVVAPLMASVPYASPNPFNPQTSILFEVGGSRDVAGEVVIYNLKGQAVRNLFQGTISPGPQNLVWNGRNNEGRHLATGVYFAQVRLADQSKTVKMTLVK